MVYYLSTPLFSIQEAAKSEASLSASVQVYQDRTKTLEERYLALTADFKRSETIYREDIRALYGVLGMFDPVYNTYFDNSYEDITDEMVAQRKSQNLALKQTVKDIALHHRYLYDYLHDVDAERALCSIAKWVLRANELYANYLSVYRVDPNHSKAENHLRRHPVKKLHDLHDFISALKELVFHLQATPSTASLISNLEIGLHQLKKSVDQAAQLSVPDRDIAVENAKDVSMLKPVSVALSTDNLDFENGFKCKLFYFHKIQSVSMNFEQVEVALVKGSKYKQLALLELGPNGRTLIFAPIGEKQFKFVHKVDNNTIQFDNYGDDAQLFFTADQNTNSSLWDLLMEMFPPNQKFVPHNKHNGLGIQHLAVEKPEPIKEIGEDNTLSFVPNKAPAAALAMNVSNGSRLAGKFMQDIMEDVDSDEDMDDMSIVSMEVSPVREMFSSHSMSETKLVSVEAVEEIPLPAPASVSAPEPTPAQPVRSSSPIRSLSRKNTSATSLPTKRSFMGKLTSMLRRDNNSNASLILEQASTIKISRPTSPTDEGDIGYLIANPNTCTSFQLPHAKVSFWKQNAWTEGSVQAVRLLQIKGRGKYLALYNKGQPMPSKPASLIKIGPEYPCQQYSLDLHLNSVNEHNTPVVVLLRTNSHQNQTILRSAIEDYDFKSASDEQAQMPAPAKTPTGAISNSSSWQSMRSNGTVSTAATTASSSSQHAAAASFNGIGTACILRDGKMRRSDRCVITASRSVGGTHVEMELTGYEFGRVDLRLQRKDVSKFDSMDGPRILVSDKASKYILGFDTVQDLEKLLHMCVAV